MSRPVTLAGYAVLVLAIVGYEVAGVLGRGRTPTLAQAFEPLRSRLGGRVLLLAVWLWLGWHLFVRGAWR